MFRELPPSWHWLVANLHISLLVLQALEQRDSDLETAVQLLGHVLQVRNKAYGENAPECADTYLYYGQVLFEQAQVRPGKHYDQAERPCSGCHSHSVAHTQTDLDQQQQQRPFSSMAAWHSIWCSMYPQHWPAEDRQPAAQG